MNPLESILLAIGERRQSTIALYAQLAQLTDAASIGWKVREPGQPDVTLELIRHALRNEPQPARDLLRRIIQNDEEILRLTKELIK